MEIKFLRNMSNRYKLNKCWLHVVVGKWGFKLWFILHDGKRLGHLEIPNGYSEAVSWRTDNAMAKRNRTKRHTNHYNKLEHCATQTPLKTGDELRCSGMISSSCSTSCTKKYTYLDSVNYHNLYRHFTREIKNI